MMTKSTGEERSTYRKQSIVDRDALTMSRKVQIINPKRGVINQQAVSSDEKANLLSKKRDHEQLKIERLFTEKEKCLWKSNDQLVDDSQRLSTE